MDQTGKILVTGATGNTGGHVAAQLRERGADVRAVVRNPETASLPDDIEVVAGDLSDPDSLEPALDGVGAMFLVYPTLQADETMAAMVGRVAKQVRHIVYLSADGVPDDRNTPTVGIIESHARLERLIKDSGMAWTILRAGGMAVNTLGWAEQIRSTRTVRWPYAGAARSLVHEADLARVATLALTRPGHTGATYVITGPEVLTQTDQARIIGDAIGEPVQFDELSRAQARTQLIDEWGWPPATADGALDAWAAMVGDEGKVTSTYEELIGRTATSFRQWAADHADDFR